MNIIPGHVIDHKYSGCFLVLTTKSNIYCELRNSFFNRFLPLGPFLEVLDRICSAIDSQIGNMVSLISLPDDDVTGHPAIAGIAALFGLHAFCFAGVVAENDELLGSLEMYCCFPRRPSFPRASID